MPHRKDVASEVLANLRRIIRAIHSRSSSIEAELGITGPQLWALREIDASVQGLALSELADRLALHRANAGRLVERLVTKKLVQCVRLESDRRFVLVHVTSKGRELARRPVTGPAQAYLLMRLGRLDPSDLDLLDRSVARLVELLGAEALEPDALFEDQRVERESRSRRPARGGRRRSARRARE